MRSKNRAFTLIELLSVIIILAIILVVAVPKIMQSIESSKVNAFMNNEKLVLKSAELYVSKNIDNLPVNIGDTTEILLSILITDGYIKDIKSPFNKNNSCNGYVLITKKDIDLYDYTPYINCINNIGSSLQDGLLSHYKFDDFQEPTENLVTQPDLSNNINTTIGSSSVVKESFDVSGIIKNGIKWTQGPTTENVGFYLLTNQAPTSTKSITLSYLYKSDVSGIVGKNQIKCIIDGVQYWLNNDRTEWSTNILEVNFIGYGYDNVNNWERLSLTLPPFPVGTLSSFTINSLTYRTRSNFISYITDFQIEAKGYSTPFVNGIRQGIIKDYSINNNHLTLPLNNTPKWIDNSILKRGGAYTFDGINDYIDYGAISNNILRQGKESETWTLSLWTENVQNQDANTRILLARAGWHAGIEMSTNMIVRFIIFDEFDASKVIASQPLVQNTNNHIVATYVDRTMYLYVNGDLIGTNTYFKDNPTIRFRLNTSSFTSGATNIGTSHQYKGTINDVRVYSRALSEQEINLLYETTK